MVCASDNFKHRNTSINLRTIELVLSGMQYVCIIFFILFIIYVRNGIRLFITDSFNHLLIAHHGDHGLQIMIWLKLLFRNPFPMLKW
jgi:hypothetical protein